MYWPKDCNVWSKRTYCKNVKGSQNRGTAVCVYFKVRKYQPARIRPTSTVKLALFSCIQFHSQMSPAVAPTISQLSCTRLCLNMHQNFELFLFLVYVTGERREKCRVKGHEWPVKVAYRRGQWAGCIYRAVFLRIRLPSNWRTVEPLHPHPPVGGDLHSHLDLL